MAPISVFLKLQIRGAVMGAKLIRYKNRCGSISSQYDYSKWGLGNTNPGSLLFVREFYTRSSLWSTLIANELSFYFLVNRTRVNLNYTKF